MRESPNFEISNRIWSNSTCMLLVFVGASAEFPLNPAVDWLFYTGKLPNDPIARFLSTLGYLRRIIAADEQERIAYARELTNLHRSLEQQRGYPMPKASYRDVLFMDTIYSIRSVPLVTGRDLTLDEKDAVVREFMFIGHHMGLTELPNGYAELCECRSKRMVDLNFSEHTSSLLAAYRDALGMVGYELLLSAYPTLVDPEIMAKLGLRSRPLTPVLRYGLATSCRTGLIRLLYRILLPEKMRATVLTW